VVGFGQDVFGVPIAVGPVETLGLNPGSLDVIAMMDVLEHLPDLAATLRHCLALLKSEGLMLIQTPQFREGMCYEELVESRSPFLDQLKSDEHLYLFSERSVAELFHRIGEEHIQFEPAIFAHYDMFFAASRVPLQGNSSEQTEAALLATPNGRIALAMLDLRERELELARKLHESEEDRAARLEQILKLTDMVQQRRFRFWTRKA
jgi:SAM-dependent methyltransferase